MKKSNVSDKILLIGTAVILLCSSLGLCVFPAARFSAAENRNLAAFPVFSLPSLASGAYTEALDNFATERVPFRTLCRRVYATAELGLGRRESHGVILCRDGSLCRRLPVNEQLYSQNLSALSRLEKRLGTLPVCVAIAPRRIDARDEVLPASYDTVRERDAWGQLPAHAVTFLEQTKDAQWYRTDHHWSSEGAYDAYAKLSGHLGYVPYPASAFHPVSVCESFLGTSAAAAGFVAIVPDTITAWRYEGDVNYRVLRDGNSANFTGLYDAEKLHGHDPYAFFLGGNCGLLQIDLGEGDERPVLLVIKDSFANSVLPFLARHYRILAIDPRYRANGLAALAEKADAVLLLCGMQTISQSPFFSLLK